MSPSPLTSSNTYPPYPSKCQFLLSFFFMLPSPHWLHPSSKSLLCSPFTTLLTPIHTLTPLHSFPVPVLKTNTKMMQTINPYATARTAEIMSRYRPIAPKPELPPSSNSVSDNDQNSGVPQSISKSPYLRNVWANLQARPTRTRKRGRTAAFAPPTSKRSRTCLQGLTPPYPVITTNPAAKNLAMHGFAHVSSNGQISLIPNLVPLKCALDTAVTTLAESVAALPLLRSPQLNGSIDLNMEVSEQSPPQELDFMPQLKEPVKPTVISPRPVRPVGSSIFVKSIADDPGRQAAEVRKPEEVEKEVEAEAAPAIVSDSGNKVRMANCAYREMVGQPECCWLDCVSACGGACRRIGGEVVLQFEESKVQMAMHGFTCRVRIEWGSNGKKSCVEALCSGVKIACEAKDYQFLWRFHAINATNDASKSASDI